jgi:hypothetical protein
MYQLKYGAATMLSWAVMMFSSVTLAVATAILISFAVVAIHSTLRRLDAPLPAFAQSPKRQAALGRMNFG